MKKVSLTVLLTSTALIAACSDSSVAPQGRAPEALPIVGGGITTDLSSTDTSRFTFTIDPNHNTTYNLGNGHTVQFPAGSVCDPATSSYGPTEWDAPCIATGSPITVSAKAWLDAGGHPHVDFMPHLRFVPSLSPSNWVTLNFGDFQASLNVSYNILYCPDVGACYKDAPIDATQSTAHNPVAGKVSRRIKHFSGYMVGAGDGSTPPMTKIAPGSKLSSVTASGDSSGQETRTGYMLASGRQEQ